MYFERGFEAVLFGGDRASDIDDGLRDKMQLVQVLYDHAVPIAATVGTLITHRLKNSWRGMYPSTAMALA